MYSVRPQHINMFTKPNTFELMKDRKQFDKITYELGKELKRWDLTEYSVRCELNLSDRLFHLLFIVLHMRVGEGLLAASGKGRAKNAGINVI